MSRAQSAWSKAQTTKSKEQRVVKERPKFRFMDLQIWQDSMEVAGRLFDSVDRLESRGLFRFAEQLRGSGLSMSNNIAEGSGSNSTREFSNFLNIARRSTFQKCECNSGARKTGADAGKRSDRPIRTSRSFVPQNHKLSEDPQRLAPCALRLAHL